MSIEWVQSYTVERARVGLIDLTVRWESSRDLTDAEKEQFQFGYHAVSITGSGAVNSKKKFATSDEAKTYAIALAKTWIAKMATLSVIWDKFDAMVALVAPRNVVRFNIGHLKDVIAALAIISQRAAALADDGEA